MGRGREIERLAKEETERLAREQKEQLATEEAVRLGPRRNGRIDKGRVTASRQGGS